MSPQEMTWDSALAELLDGPPSLDALASALVARGRMAPGAHRLDERLLAAGEDALTRAALAPGVATLERRLAQAAAHLWSVDEELAGEAEEAAAQVLEARDCAVLRALALERLGLTEAAGATRLAVAGLDRSIRAQAVALEALSWRKAGRSPALEHDSIWAIVPEPAEPDDGAETAHQASAPVSDEALALVAAELADPALERRVARALERDEALRVRYDQVLAEIDAFDDLEEAPLPLLITGAPPARRQLVRASVIAAESAPPAFETPEEDAVRYIFPDESELYVQTEGDRWVLLLYRTSPGGALEGESLQESWENAHWLAALAPPGLVTARRGGVVVRLRLAALP